MVGQGAAPTTEDADARTPPTRRQIAAVALGNALEFYDFTVYAYFAVQIGLTFFPFKTPFLSLMASLAAFGIGFAGRPLGAILIGAYGDRIGRKPAMLLSFALMGAAILLLALTPSFATIGIAAPVIVVAARLLQGIAVGGDVGPTTAFLLESAPEERRGFFTSLQYATQGWRRCWAARLVSCSRACSTGTIWQPMAGGLPCSSGRRSCPSALSSAAPCRRRCMRRTRNCLRRRRRFCPGEHWCLASLCWAARPSVFTSWRISPPMHRPCCTCARTSRSARRWCSASPTSSSVCSPGSCQTAGVESL